MQSIISIKDLTKTYAGGFEALKKTDLEIRRGECAVVLGRSVWASVPDHGMRALPAVLVPCDDLEAPGDVDSPGDLE